MNKRTRVTEQTRRKLINSFWELYKSKDINKITVVNVCRLADYERTTFYKYFTDINDLFNVLESEIIENIRTDIQNNNRINSQEGIFFDGFKKFTDKYGEYIVVFYEKGNRNFYNKFKELVKTDVYNYLNFNIQDEKKKEFLFEFIFSSLINSYAYWYRNQKMMSLKLFVEFTNNMLLNGINTVISHK